MSTAAVTPAQSSTPAGPKAIPAAPTKNASGNPDLSSSLGSTRSSIRSTKSSKSSKLGQTPPYWNRHRRTTSNVSYVSVTTPTRRPPILLEDHTEERDESTQGLWARGVTIDDHHVVSGATIAAGSYVVWHCRVETLEGCPLEIGRRYSEFDLFRDRLLQTFPNSASAIPELPPKSVVSRFRAKFLEKRRQGLQFFLTCVLLNPEFASSPVLKAFIFC